LKVCVGVIYIYIYLVITVAEVILGTCTLQT